MKKNAQKTLPNRHVNDRKTRSFEQILALRLSRREVLKGGLGLAVASLFPPLATANTQTTPVATVANTKQAADSLFSQLRFKPIPIADGLDTVEVPEGYSAQVFFAWGDPISDGKGYKVDASNSAEEQATQAGMHHDGMQFFPLPADADREDETLDHGLLVINHEYIAPDILHNDGGFRSNPTAYSAEKAAKEIAAHGVSVLEIKKNNQQWQIVRPSALARRITGATPIKLSGAAAGSHWLKTKDDPTGTTVLGTNNNCASGRTPWGTYLACEENFQHMFSAQMDKTKDNKAIAELHNRYHLAKSINYGWYKHHVRFDVAKEPNEPNRFGWMVEIDPYDPNSKPIKRTAMGRFKHENCAYLEDDKRRTAFYSGDDTTFEYIYKFVPNKAYDADNRANNRDLLDDGILYVARFNDDGTGTWLPLVHGQNGLTVANGFADQADILVKTRFAADQVKATPMDRPEWIDVHPITRKIYCCLTNNGQRTKANINKANPRIANQHGQIITWSEKNNNPLATEFTWDLFVLAGDPASKETHLQGNIQGDIFSSPDGLYIDPRGAIWIQTDISGSKQNKKGFAQFGNNQMLVADPETRQVKRLTGPVGCEVTGMVLAPDMKTMWVNIQHPEGHWPEGGKQRPRSATIMISKDDGGKIGI